jgi:hypothetical protein
MSNLRVLYLLSFHTSVIAIAELHYEVCVGSGCSPRPFYTSFSTIKAKLPLMGTYLSRKYVPNQREKYVNHVRIRI